MVRQYEHIDPPDLENPGQVEWSKGIIAGLIAGLILIFVPQGSPWSGLAFSEPVVMGRNVPGMSLGLVWLIHLGLSVIYGLVICRVIATYRIRRALVMAGLTGIGLYVINLATVSLIWGVEPQNEISVVFTHIVFALLTAGAYRGLLRRKVVRGQGEGLG